LKIMGFLGPKPVETGVFTSPALGVDAPYHLIEDPNAASGFVVRCLESDTLHDVGSLARPTMLQIGDQLEAFIRELCAWLVANGPNSPARRRTAVREIRRLTGEDYTVDDLDDDVHWILAHDLGQRLPILGTYLDEAERLTLMQLGAELGAAGSGLAESDAQFLELLGAGLQIDSDTVARIVMSAVTNASLRAG
jgi:hypothetical protein